jgi:nucleoside 2-deoxyribosyltransferase
MRAYISGPMSGLPDENFPAFAEAAAKLRAEGFEVVNPAELKVDVTGLTGRARWCKFLKADIKELVDCDAIVMLPGWRLSEGATLELHIADKLGIKVFYSPETLLAMHPKR